MCGCMFRMRKLYVHACGMFVYAHVHKYVVCVHNFACMRACAVSVFALCRCAHVYKYVLYVYNYVHFMDFC